MTDPNSPSWETDPRCDEAQLAMLHRCSEAKDMTVRQYYEKFVQPNMGKNPMLALKRELTAEDIGHATVFLASEKSRILKTTMFHFIETFVYLSTQIGLHPEINKCSQRV